MMADIAAGAHKAPKLVSVRNASFSYEGDVPALKDVSLDIAEGELLAVVGGNGSGKTTLAKHFIGLLSPSSGDVVVGGRPTTDATVADLARVVGYVFQNPDHQLFCTSVEDEVGFGPKNMGLPAEEVSRRVDSALDVMALGALRERAPFSLSLGDRRKVTIASVLATEPQLIVFDEPTTGLDHSESAQLMTLIKRLSRQGQAIVLITHEMALVAEHVDRVVVMVDGSIASDASARETFSDPALLRRCRLAAPPVTELAHRLRRHGMSKAAFSPEELATELMALRGAWP